MHFEKYAFKWINGAHRLLVFVVMHRRCSQIQQVTHQSLRLMAINVVQRRRQITRPRLNTWLRRAVFWNSLSGFFWVSLVWHILTGRSCLTLIIKFSSARADLAILKINQHAHTWRLSNKQNFFVDAKPSQYIHLWTISRVLERTCPCGSQKKLLFLFSTIERQAAKHDFCEDKAASESCYQQKDEENQCEGKKDASH